MNPNASKQARSSAGTGGAAFALAVLAMGAVVTASNVLVQHPIRQFGLHDWLTWGALSYPFAFLVTDITNRRFGPTLARRVVLLGFVLGVVLSVALASPRIAIASGTAFLAGQLADVAIFQALRHHRWWVAPLASSLLASAIDTALFFSLAFHCGPVAPIGLSIETVLGVVGIPGACEILPWQQLALADFAVKLVIALAALVPYGLITARWQPAPQAA